MSQHVGGMTQRNMILVSYNTIMPRPWDIRRGESPVFDQVVKTKKTVGGALVRSF